MIDIRNPEMEEALTTLRGEETPFAIATIVRAAGATSAKPGAKAILRADGTILHGWLGGGCTRSAVKQAVLAALEDGVPKLISVAPEDALEEKGVTPGDEVAGVRFARNGCPSEGTVDIFIEPCLPAPVLTVYGSSPVAEALSELGGQFNWALQRPENDKLPGLSTAVVIATQGQGDLQALTTALSGDVGFIAFVGSAKKFAALSRKLRDAGIAQDKIDQVHAPAGLDIGAVTPEEIALSILAQLTSFRRRKDRR